MPASHFGTGGFNLLAQPNVVVRALVVPVYEFPHEIL